MRDSRAVDQCAVAAVQIVDSEVTVGFTDLGVVSRQPLIGKHEVVALGSTDGEDGLFDREAKGLSMEWAYQKFGLLRHSGLPGSSLFLDLRLADTRARASSSKRCRLEDTAN